MDSFLAMRAFAKVAELGSFTRAADALGLSRAMVSTHVSSLEKRYGVRLLNRTTRKVALTSEGQRYLERCRTVLRELEAAEHDLQLARERPTGRLRVDVPGSFGRNLLIPALAEFQARYPDIQLQIRLNDRIVDLAMEQVDVAVRGGAVTDPELVARPAAASWWLTCASPEYLDRHGWPRSADDLRQHRLIGFGGAGTTPPRTWMFNDAGLPRPLDAPFRLTVDDPEAMMLAAVHGVGVIQTIDLLAATSLERRELVAILPGTAVRGPSISVVYPRAAHRLAKVRVFADFTLGLLQHWQGKVARITGLGQPP